VVGQEALGYARQVLGKLTYAVLAVFKYAKQAQAVLFAYKF
jgi:hypothetical protein